MTTTNDRINETRISTSSIGKFDPGVKERFDKLNRAISRRTEERRSWNENRDYAFLKIRMRGKDDFASETDEPTPNKIGAWMRRR